MYSLLLLSVVLMTANTGLTKVFQRSVRFDLKSMAMYNLVNALLACGIFFASAGFRIRVNLPTLVYALVYAAIICVNLSAQNGEIITGPDIITRGFIYVKESEELMDSLREVAEEAIDRCRRKRIRDWSAIKTAIKNDLSGYLYKTTKRNPMILPVIMEV